MAEWEENELFQQWLEADPASRGDIEPKLYAAVKRHAQAVLWKQLNEPTPDLLDEVANAVMTQLAEFRRDSKFSTWVEGIARRKAKQYIRGRVRARRVFDERVAVVESHSTDDYGEPHVREVTPSVVPTLDSEISAQQFRKGLSTEDAAVLRGKEEGMNSKDVAKAAGTTVEAVDSRRARLKRKARKFFAPRRK